MNRLDTEVLVIGSGPSGATAALALATYGVKVLALNKYGSTAPTPRAHITNQRTLEILRDFNLENRAMAEATPHGLMRDHVFCLSLAGKELGRMEAWGNHPRLKMQHDLASPCTMVDLTQDILEPILITAASIRGAKIRFDSEMIGIAQDDDGVSTTVRDRLTGDEFVVRSRYVIGADGGNSAVMSALGLPLQGKRDLAASIAIGFRADLSQFVEHRPGDMYWMVQPGHGILGYSLGSLRMVRAWDRWIASWGYDPHQPDPTISDERATRIVHDLIGDASVPVQIETFTTYRMNQLHATRIRSGRVFCVGDAIHRHPPMNGLGSNTSIQDSYNLAWKLAAVLRGQAGQPLLDSYETERLPVAEHLVTKTMANMRIWGPVVEPLGLEQREQSQEELDTLIESLHDRTPEAMLRRAKFHAGVATNVYGYSAVGGEHNLLYRSSAVVEDDRPLTVDDPELEVILGIENGRRLPHMWVTRDQRRLSTLDLVGKGRFTLLTGPNGEGWKDIAAEVERALGVSLQVVTIGLGEEIEDVYGDFGRVCLDDETGAVLVRPDQVVAWRAPRMPTNPAGVLTDVLRSVLSLGGGADTPFAAPGIASETAQPALAHRA